MSSTRPAGSRMPRLLLITPDFPPARGGIQTVAHRIATGLQRFEVRVVTLDGEGARELDAGLAFAVARVRAGRRLGGARNLLLGARALAEAARWRPDMTLSVHIVASPAAAVISAALGAPTVQCFHAKEVGNKPRLAAFAARRARASIAPSSYSAGLLDGVGASRSKITLIPPGVDLPIDSAPIDSARPTLLTIARLEDRYKGHDVLMRALGGVRERVPDVEWVVIGEGPLRAELEQLARSLGVEDCVRFLGAVSDEERNSWLRRADLLAMPSRLPEGRLAGEGFGIVYMEAAAYGKPVVAGNVGGAVDAVLDGETGLLVDPADPAAVGDAVARLLGDPELAHRLGAAGAERAQSFAWPRVVDRVEALLVEQLGRGLAP
jgi:phosphatidylinositol alpha-1,6-mannosyltransferase